MTKQNPYEARTLSRDTVRYVDAYAIEQVGISGLVLMENAGRGTVDQMFNAGINGAVCILCGVGNNAGDGFVVARHLAVRGVKSRCVLAAAPEKLKGDALANYQIARKLPEVDWMLLDEIDSADNSIARRIIPDILSPIDDQQIEWLVDGLLGTGASGSPREPMARLIAFANRTTTKRLSLDLPSGLDCETGETPGNVFQADITCTYAAYKPGLLTESAKKCVGELICLDIGIPPSIIDQAANAYKETL